MGNKLNMKFNTIALLLVSSVIALRVRDDAPVASEKNAAAVEKAAKGEENATEAKDAEWQNPYGKVGFFGEYEGRIGGHSVVHNGTAEALAKKEAEAKGEKKDEPEAKLGEKIDGDIKSEEAPDA